MSTKSAAAIKDEANDAFKSSKFPLALRLYSEAIDQLEEEGLGTSTEAAKYFANRAYANLKLENYGAAVADGERAIELDTSFAKGYYRGRRVHGARALQGG